MLAAETWQLHSKHVHVTLEPSSDLISKNFPSNVGCAKLSDVDISLFVSCDLLVEAMTFTHTNTNHVYGM